VRSSNLGFFLREALKNLRLNLLMSVTAATTTVICVLILGLGLVTYGHIGAFLDSIGRDISMTAYFPEDFSSERVEEVRGNVEAYPEVSEVRYVSKEQALEDFKESLSEQPDIVEGLPSDVLPASLEITLNNPGDSGAVAQRLQDEGFGQDDLRRNEELAESFETFAYWVMVILGTVTALFLLASVLLISNVIRLSIFARRKEIEVMKLVGASDGFVRWPFVLEGLAQGLVGATLAALVVVWANALFVEWAQGAVPFFGISTGSVNTLLLLPLLILVGVAIGVFGSFVSVSRFLKV
jgi:cell division transport system permease protein